MKKKTKSEISNPLSTIKYPELLAEVKERIRSAQYAALKAVNKELIGLYWDIGKMIVERQLDAAHGSAIAEQLATDLRMEFPGIKGFSRRNIFYMRELYLAYYELPKVQPLVAQIGWTHNLIVVQHCKGTLEREFYIRVDYSIIPPAGVRVVFRVLDCPGEPVRLLTDNDVTIINDEKDEPFGAGMEGGGVSELDAPQDFERYSILATASNRRELLSTLGFG